MAAEQSLLYFDGNECCPPSLLQSFAREQGLELSPVHSVAELMEPTNRGFPACLVLSTEGDSSAVLEICQRMKSDPFTAIVPFGLLVPDAAAGLPTEGLQSGAEEVIREDASDRDKVLGLDLLMRRAARDVSVHPTTRLPGTTQIERDLVQRLEQGGTFALCYADLDHFKEFDDRYGYNRGDRVILIVSKIIRDMVRALAPEGFAGHIGGDDFTFSLPLAYMEPTCDEVIELFDDLIPFQYSEEDRRTGYFLGKDRRGSLHRIPLMTLSIGIVTNQVHGLSHPAGVSERAG